MNHQEQNSQSQISGIQQKVQEKEKDLEHLILEESEKWISFMTNLRRDRKEDLNNFLHENVNNIIEFAEKRDRKLGIHKEKNNVFKITYLEELMELDKDVDISFTRLMDEHVPSQNEKVTTKGASN